MNIQILEGDCLETLKTLPEKSVQCVVTSPPYYGLRDYGTAKWVGGDKECEHVTGNQVQDNKAPGAIDSGVRPGSNNSMCRKCGAKRIDSQIGLEPSPEAYVDALVKVFREVWRVLKDDGTLWLNLGDSYWGGKGQSGSSDPEYQETRNASGDSLTRSASQVAGRGKTRPTDGKHPSIKPKDLIGIPWMVAFALRSDSWYLRQDIIWAKPNPMPESVTDRCTKSHEYIFLLTKRAQYFYDAEAIAEESIWAKRDKRADGTGKHLSSGKCATGEYAIDGVSYGKQNDDGDFMRNRRSVWTITTQPYSGAHFATFPPDLIEPCILAGSRPGDTVLDPFNGSGTTGAVAIKHHRNYVGCELNPKYVKLTMKRLQAVQPVLLLDK